MELIVMILAPFPIGWFVRDRLTALVAYLALHAYVFTFQTAALLIGWTGGDESAFGPYPDARTSDVFAYGGVNLVILLIGIGLVLLGHRLRLRRRTSAVSLEAAA